MFHTENITVSADYIDFKNITGVLFFLNEEIEYKIKLNTL